MFIQQNTWDTIRKRPFIDERQRPVQSMQSGQNGFIITLFFQEEVHVRRVLMCWKHSTLFLHNFESSVFFRKL